MKLPWYMKIVIDPETGKELNKDDNSGHIWVDVHYNKWWVLYQKIILIPQALWQIVLHRQK